MELQSSQLNYLLVAFFSIFITACVDTSSTAKKIVEDRHKPVGTANNIRMVYTDSARTQAILTAPKHIDYTNTLFFLKD